MCKQRLKNKIILNKITLNLLLKFLRPTNFIVVYISQNLDRHIWRYQHVVYKKYRRKTSKSKLLSKSKVA